MQDIKISVFHIEIIKAMISSPLSFMKRDERLILILVYM